VIAGTLAYMAPEQTGRMNRSTDSRSDLYSLGVTFYEMLTGELPFTASDPMEWVHCHIARRPAAHRTGRGRRCGDGRSRSIAAGVFEPDHERRGGDERGDGACEGADDILDAICRSIIEARGGRLSVSTRALHGAKVRFTVPLWAEQ
jgi:serine/threonine protein kinase